MKILVAIDDSIFADTVANSLIAQRKPKDTDVALLHILASFPVTLAERMGSKELPDFTAARLELRKEAESYLGRVVDKLRSTGFTASYELKEGDAREIILDYSERWHADLIIRAPRFKALPDGQRIGNYRPVCHVFRRNHSSSRHGDGKSVGFTGSSA